MTQSQTATYKAALKEARAAFEKASNRAIEISLESHKLSSEIRRLRRTITALAALCSEEPGFDDLGITDACWEVMETALLDMSTMDVVRSLESMGFDFSGQKSPAASVHAILTRMAHQEKIQKVKDEEDKILWRGPKYDPDAIPF